ncbi:MAG: hypothetical protein COB93_05010 [Sneathiella sp.]|nr:MAG: hypothetical protein COB93_05010 [Sneathiella sp.]
MMNEADILDLVHSDPWMMEVLAAARSLDLPDWMIGAGFIRGKVWNHLHGFDGDQTVTMDIDLIYFEADDTSKATEKDYDRMLGLILDADWSTKNQARMHTKNDRMTPFQNTFDALSEWVETPTCIAVRLNDDGTLALFAPHGIDDLVNLIVRPTPAFHGKHDVYQKRLREKNWTAIWPLLRILED